MLRFFFELAEQGDPKAEHHSRSAPHTFFEGMDTHTWEDTRLKLAQALSTEEFANPASYYQALVGAKKIVAEGMESIDTHRTIRFSVNRLHELVQEVEQIIRTHVPDITTNELTGEDLKRLGYNEDDLKQLGYE